MMKAILLVILFFLVLMPAKAMALSCAEMPSTEDAYEIYDGVIIGQVVDVSKNNESNKIKLKVIKSYKGIEENSLLADENMTWGSLWGPSEVGQEYLFFLRENDNGWENPLCSPTKKVADASEDLTYLQEKEITLNKVSAIDEPSVDNNTIVDLVSEDSGMGDSPTNNNWFIIMIIVCFIGILGYGVIRFAKRGSNNIDS